MNLVRAGMGAVSAWYCLVAYAHAEVDPAVVERIRAGNLTSIDAIRTLHARYTVVQADRPKGGGEETIATMTVEWWQEGKQSRWVQYLETALPKMAAPGKGGKGHVPHYREEGVIAANGEVKIRESRLSPDGKWQPIGGTIRNYSTKEVLGIDPWSSALVHLSHVPRATLVDLLQQEPKQILQCEPEQIDGQKCYRLQVLSSSGERQHHVLVDPRYNYLVRWHSATKASKKARNRSESRVERFQEPAPGIFFPAEVVTHVYRVSAENGKGELRTTSRTKFTHIVVNQSIDPRLFDLELLPGTPIDDHRNNTSYVIGKDQKPVGEVVPFTSGGRDVEVKPTYAQAAGWSWPLLIAAAAGVALLIGAGWCFIRSRNTTADQGPMA
jgi:hypothetical protein